MIPIIPKRSKPVVNFIKSTAKILLVVELVGFGVSYGVWHRMNRNQEFRGYINEHFPILLEGFYKLGETFDPSSLEYLRKIDAEYFAVQKSQKN